MLRSSLTCACALAALLTSAAAGATDYTIEPGPEGQDTAPYSFLPSSPRGQNNLLWAFVGEEDGIEHSFEIYLKFPLPPIDPSEEVIEAVLEVTYAFDSTGFGSGSNVPGELHCHEVLEAWDEDVVTWSKRPDIAPAFDVRTNLTALGVISCDVTELVEAWLAGTKPNHGIALTNPTERLIGMYSWEDATLDSVGKQATLRIETTGAVTADADSDGIDDAEDNCPETPNTLQQDTEGDEVGDACDVCPAVFDPAQVDTNGDGRGDQCGQEVTDLDDDGYATKLDKKLFKAATKKSAAYRADCDLNGDEVVNKADGALWDPIYKEFFVKKPPQ